MKVPFLDLARETAELRAELDAAWSRVARSGAFVLGEELEQFEREFAAACSTASCVGVGSGLDALTLVLRAWGIGPGDEVIVPGQTFIATWLAVSALGAVPVPVDIVDRSYSIDRTAVERALTERTRAIVPVHLYGLPAPVPELMELATERNLLVVEDAAQAHGAWLDGRPVGGLAHAAAWSFYPAKNLGALGDGGAVTTNDPALAAEIRRLRNYGGLRKHEHLRLATNSRLDELQAAFLRVKLRHLPEWNERRRQIAGRYLDELEGSVELPEVPAGSLPSWHLFVVQSDERDGLTQHLDEQGIGWLLHYPVPPHRTGAYATTDLARWPLPVSERVARRALSLPMGPQLTATEVDRVIAAIRGFRRRQGGASTGGLAPRRPALVGPPPLVSVNLVTFDHERYIAEAVHSILGQTLRDLELVVVDDGSSDGTSAVLESIRDTRLRIVRTENGGPSLATSRGLALCRGRYVALMTGDDVAEPTRIERQLEVYRERGRRLLLSNCSYIDEDGAALDRPNFAERVFRSTSGSNSGSTSPGRAAILRQFFRHGNFLNSVTLFTELDAMLGLGAYSPGLFVLQDFEILLRAVKRYEIEILPERLLRYRIRALGANLSAPSLRTHLRHDNERALVMRGFFDDLPEALFRETFDGELRRPDLDGPLARQCEEAFLYLDSPHADLRQLGVERIHELLSRTDAQRFLQAHYEFRPAALAAYLADFNPWCRHLDCATLLQADTGSGFGSASTTGDLAGSGLVGFAPHTPEFAITFELPGAPEVRSLRWKPVVGRVCSLSLETVRWIDSEGRKREFDPKQATHSGRLDAAGSICFYGEASLDLPIRGRVREVTLTGGWHVLSARDSVLAVQALLARARTLTGRLTGRF